MRPSWIVLGFALVGCGERTYPTLCDLHPEQCCDLRPDVPECVTDSGGDTGADAETGTCSGPTTEACGKCGTRTRTCKADGTFTEWSGCSAEGECAAGAVETVAGAACPRAIEVRQRVCTATCAWAEAVCALPKGWTPILAPPAGFTGRWRSAQTWTGSEYFVWGGANGTGDVYFGDGARWNPKTGTWTKTAKAPTELGERADATAVPTGLDVIVWGGQVVSGPTPGRNTGARYVAFKDEWVAMAASPLEARYGHSAVWTGTKMLVWGGSGVGSEVFADGASYDPGVDTWTALPPAPISARTGAAAAWTGTEFIVFGGNVGEFVSTPDGAAFNPTTGLWRKLDPYPGPTRQLAGVHIQASTVLVFGGFTLTGTLELQDDGRWWSKSGWSTVSPLSLTSLTPAPRILPATWCRGEQCWIWSGCNDGKTGKLDKLVPAAGGAMFDRVASKWTLMDAAREPSPRATQSVVDAGDFVVVWGGWECGDTASGSGAVFVP